ncbi:MAG: hypothetical protein IJU44_06615 [Kiritimatiellae bacterium]|nr:hypothetical protein [Kiritimatiellia bacterium]
MRSAYILFVLPFLIANFAQAAPVPDEQLRAEFANPPDSAKPHVWWHWMNGNVSKAGITADLEAMKSAGIGGAQIFDVSDGIPKGPVDFLSPEWYDLVDFALSEAERLGIEICLANCSGWSSTGGPWVTPEESMKSVVYTETCCSGAFDGTLPQPANPHNFYEDIAVLAVPLPAAESVSLQDYGMTVSAPKLDRRTQLGFLTDGQTKNGIDFQRKGKDKVPSPIVFSFGKPFPLRGLTLSMTTQNRYDHCFVTVESADADGSAFRPLVNSYKVFLRSYGDSPRESYIPVPAVNAGKIRVNIELTSASPYKITELRPEAKAGLPQAADKLFQFRSQILYRPYQFEPSFTVPKAGIVNLTSLMKKDGSLQWEAPPGDWALLRIGYACNGAYPRPATPAGAGLECDKLDSEAVTRSFNAYVGKVIENAGKRRGAAPTRPPALNNTLIDSYEVGCQNWTRGFDKIFEKRCGYSFIPYLTVFSGRIIGSVEETERALEDFRATISELFCENYSKKFAELCHRHGMSLSLEGYGNAPCDDLAYSRWADIPMGEFWASAGNGLGSGGNGHFGASVSHVWGQKFVAAEAFTAGPETGRWLKDPFSLKAQGDRIYCTGINRMVYHRYAHQPWVDAAHFPGMTMGPHGTHFERTLTWWNQSSDWLAYQARCQYLLQSGTFVADALFFVGDQAPNYGLDIDRWHSYDRGARPAGHPTGYDWDICGADALPKLQTADGRIVSPGNTSYRMLVLPDREWMSLKTIGELERLAAQSAKIVGKTKPRRILGLSGGSGADRQLRDRVEKLWQRSVEPITAGEALEKLGLAKDCECLNPDLTNKFSYIHRRADSGADIYFVALGNTAPTDFEVAFRVAGKTPELWDAETGKTRTAAVWREADNRTIVPLHFEPSGSIFVVFRNAAAEKHVTGLTVTANKTNAKRLEIVKAVYGVLDSNNTMDITKKLQAEIANDRLEVKISNELAGRDPARQTVKEAKIDYRLDGNDRSVTVKENSVLVLPHDSFASYPPPGGTLHCDNGKTVFTAFAPLAVTVEYSSGERQGLQVGELPPDQVLDSPWTAKFPQPDGKTLTIELSKLCSWTDRPEPEIKYFSGTATYSGHFTVNKNLGFGERVWLDLGAVRNLAEVRVNQTAYPVLWKPPFRIDITSAVAAANGAADLEIKVTNLWANRLIGDDFLPPDCKWKANGALAEIPQWIKDGKPSPTGRHTFTTWRHWTRDDQPLVSGILGPVRLLFSQDVPLND